jgi:hypothetical protein
MATTPGFIRTSCWILYVDQKRYKGMAALDTFKRFIQWLNPDDRKDLEPAISQCMEELFAARSEDARVRLVGEFIEQAHQSTRYR